MERSTTRILDTICFDFDSTLVDGDFDLVPNAQRIVREAHGLVPNVVLLTGNAFADQIIRTRELGLTFTRPHSLFAPVTFGLRGQGRQHRKGYWLRKHGLDPETAVLFDDDPTALGNFYLHGGLCYQVKKLDLTSAWNAFLDHIVTLV